MQMDSGQKKDLPQVQLGSQRGFLILWSSLCEIKQGSFRISMQSFRFWSFLPVIHYGWDFQQLLKQLQVEFCSQEQGILEASV